MKKTLLSILFVMACITAANAQVEQTSGRARVKVDVNVNATVSPQQQNPVSPNDMVLQKDEAIIMKDGKAMLQKNGEMIPLQGRVATGNGELITMEGVIMRRSGENTRLKEGQIVSFDGTIK